MQKSDKLSVKSSRRRTSFLLLLLRRRVMYMIPVEAIMLNTGVMDMVTINAPYWPLERRYSTGYQDEDEDEDKEDSIIIIMYC